MADRPPRYVSDVGSRSVTVASGRRTRRHQFADDLELAALLTSFRDEDLPFLDAGPGWPPGAVFADLRRRGLVSGPYDAIVWEGPDRFRIISDR